MNYTTLISSAELFRNFINPDWAIVDCRFTLADPNLKQSEYEKSHIPGAVYAHLERDLTGPVIPGQTGRHPLPDIFQISQFLSRIGIDDQVQVITYDDSCGAIAAARLWWMLRWLGHSAVAVLDGGWQDWLANGFPTKNGREYRHYRNFLPSPKPELLADADEVLRGLNQPGCRIIDARSADRFRGENESLDPVAGHIPGAYNAPYQNNVDTNGKFLSKNELIRQYQKFEKSAPDDKRIFYCGSGITACHDILAFAHAGLGEAQLFAGSWSEWITVRDRPVEMGERS
jgi:thiosulfate/3-mercaptopyruvate sulfurtransferase